MISISTILVPTDFSDASAAALKYGTALAQAFSSSLHVLHVVEEPIVPALVPETYSVAIPQMLEDLESRAREELGRLLTADEMREFRARTAIERGSPFVTIVKYARDHAIDLVVMGTHGRGPIAHMLLGSVAERVVRKSPCPVLTVRPAQHAFVMP
ncbi:MAG: universal stress protein [Vicinamibacterales bacterium]